MVRFATDQMRDEGGVNDPEWRGGGKGLDSGCILNVRHEICKWVGCGVLSLITRRTRCPLGRWEECGEEQFGGQSNQKSVYF